MLTVKLVIKSFSIFSFSLVGPMPGITTLVASEVQCQPGIPEGVGHGTDRDCDGGRDSGGEWKVCRGSSLTGGTCRCEGFASRKAY